MFTVYDFHSNKKAIASFTVQSGYSFWSWDHLRYNLRIICGMEIIYGPLAGLYSFKGEDIRISFADYIHRFNN